MSQNSQTGATGEQAAADFLEKQGFTVVETNYRKPYGEIDIVAKKDRTIHFVEVKTSYYHPDPAFTPEIRVNTRKIRSLKKVCEMYLAERHAHDDQLWQIDIISVILDGDAVKKLYFFENAVFERKY